MRAQPFDEDNLSSIIHRSNKAIGISLDIENDALRTDKAGIGVARFHVG